MKYIIFIIYFLTNLIFLVRYGSRQNYIPIVFLVIVFSFLHLLFILKVNKLVMKLKINKMVYYIIMLFGIVIYTFLSHLIDDPTSIQVDRWQAQEFSLKHWLNGEYIYTTRTFMNNISSYLPGQLLYLVMFWYLGNVGYLQVVALILFFFTIYVAIQNTNIRIIGSTMLLFSIPYIYDAVCKSDYISSFIIVSGFMVLWHRKYSENYFQNSVLLGILLGIICLSRMIVIFPLILFLFLSFYSAKRIKKNRFFISFFITSSLLLSSVLIPADDWQTIKNFNPFVKHGQLNKYIIILFIGISIYLSFKIHKIDQVFFASTIVFFGIMISYVIEKLIFNKINNLPLVNNIDFTYFATVVPFSIIGFCMNMEREMQQKKLKVEQSKKF